MIYIERQPIPKFLTTEKNKWNKETNAAIIYYSGNVKEINEFKFRHYRDEKMKEALMNNFPKCVYCESSYAGVSDGDIEHFRPKGRVFGKLPPSPGYYWLANSWDNLFMSCMHCNQIRKHKICNDAEARARGKLDQFPLKGKNKNRVSSHTQNISTEEHYRLLLNPCIDKPDEHLNYDENALLTSNTKKGKMSIEVYALQRPFLVGERQLRLVLLFTVIELTKKALNEYNQNKSNEESLNDLLNALKIYTDDKQPYAGMCRFFVKRFLEENNFIKKKKISSKSKKSIT